jgi:hypothetical protein
MSTEKNRGLYGRYIVRKADGSPTDPRAEYFVLRLDEHGSDPIHIEACRAAAMVYADLIEPYLPQLAADLRLRYGSGTDIEVLEWHPVEEPPDGPNLILIDAEDRDTVVLGTFDDDEFFDDCSNRIHFPKAWTDFPLGHRRRDTNSDPEVCDTNQADPMEGVFIAAAGTLDAADSLFDRTPHPKDYGA